MNDATSSFEGAKSVIRFFASDKTRYPFWVILDTLSRYGLDAMEAAGSLLDSDDDCEVILALHTLDAFGTWAHKYFSKIEECLEHHDLMIKLTAVTPLLAFEERAKSALPIFRSWLAGDEPILKVVGAHAVATIDKMQIKTMSYVLAEMLSERSVATAAIERLVQLNYLDDAILESVRAFFADPENLVSVLCSKRTYDLLGDGKLVTQVARTFIARDDSFYKIHGCKMLTQLAQYSDDETIAEVRAQLDDVDPFVVQAAEEALNFIEIPF